MPVPSPRNAVRPARGNYTDLSTNISSLKDGEICYAIDQDQLYINESGTLVPAGVTVSGIQTVTGNKTFSGDVDLTGTFQVNSVTITATAAELNYTGDLGTFTGSTIADNSDVKAALQAVETAVESGSSGGSGSLTADDAGTANYSSGTINILGDTGLSTTASGNTLNIDLDDTAVTAASYGAAGTIATFTVDAQGRLTAASDTAVSITHDQVSDFDSGVQANRLDQMAAPTSAVGINGQRITGLADPTSDQDAVTKSYADALVSGLDIKKSTRVATTTNITLSNTQTVDNISLIAGDRVLVKDQTDASENGIYDVVSGGSWTRSSDADNTPSGEVTSGMFTFVEDGDTSAGIGYVLVTPDPITLGTTDLTFTQFSEIGAITAGNGLTKTGQTLDVGTADSGRIVVNADSIDLAVSGVNAGTYNGLTVDTYGRATGFSQPTTLAGYGITDAQSLDATLTALAGVTVAADELIYATGEDAFSTTSLTTFGRSLLDDAADSDARATLGLGSASTTDSSDYATAAQGATADAALPASSVSSFGGTLIDDASASDARATLELGSIATQEASDVTITGGSIDGITIDGGTY